MTVQAGLTLAHAARISGVSTYTLRYNEKAGLIDDVERAGSGHRRYSGDDLAWTGAHAPGLHRTRDHDLSGGAQ
ncbi:MAG: MerR family DNA-binding transcriptional regulator [Solirubrobacteraceae bacterium]